MKSYILFQPIDTHYMRIFFIFLFFCLSSCDRSGKVTTASPVIGRNEQKALKKVGEIRNAFHEFKVKHSRFPYAWEEVDAMPIFSRFSLPTRDTAVKKLDGYFFYAFSVRSFWYCYAWPEQYGTTGTRSFYVDNDSSKVKSTQRKFSGIELPAMNKSEDYWSYLDDVPMKNDSSFPKKHD